MNINKLFCNACVIEQSEIPKEFRDVAKANASVTYARDQHSITKYFCYKLRYV